MIVKNGMCTCNKKKQSVNQMRGLVPSKRVLVVFATLELQPKDRP
jgi:hypothetical protein